MMRDRTVLKSEYFKNKHAAPENVTYGIKLEKQTLGTNQQEDLCSMTIRDV